MAGRKIPVATLLELPMKERLRTIRGRDTQAVFAEVTGFSRRLSLDGRYSERPLVRAAVERGRGSSY